MFEKPANRCPRDFLLGSSDVRTNQDAHWPSAAILNSVKSVQPPPSMRNAMCVFFFTEQRICLKSYQLAWANLPKLLNRCKNRKNGSVMVLIIQRLGFPSKVFSFVSHSKFSKALKAVQFLYSYSLQTKQWYVFLCSGHIQRR